MASCDKYHSCMGILYWSCLKPQKSMFKSWCSHAVWTWLLAWQNLSGPWFVCMKFYRKVLQPWLIICWCLFSKSLSTTMTLWRHCDVRKFDAGTILFRDIHCKKMDILMFKRLFQCGVGWNQVKYGRITITHVCFIALTLAGSLGRCLNTQPNGLVFKQLPQDPANVNAWKNMCYSYIISCDINCIFSAAFFDSHINKPMGKLGFLKRNQNVDTWTAINTNGLTLIDQQKCVSHCISTIYRKKNLPNLMFICPTFKKLRVCNW